MYFQQIYRFEVDLLKKFSMSLRPEQSRPREISAGRYEFGWKALDAAISKEPTKHNYATTTISPALIAIVVVLGSTLLVVSYYNIFTMYCKASRWRPFFRRRRRSLDSEENIQVDTHSLEGFQDLEGWQIIIQSYGLNEVLIRSITPCRFTKAEKFIDIMDPPENRYDVLCCYGFTTGYISVVNGWFKVCLTTIFCFRPVFFLRSLAI